MFGVLSSPKSVFVNENAFRLCHPPMMGFGNGGVGWEKMVDQDGYEVDPYKVQAAKTTNSTVALGGVDKGKGTARRYSDNPYLLLQNATDGPARHRSQSVTDNTSSYSSTRSMFASLSQASRLNSSSRMLEANIPIEKEPPARSRSGSGSALGKLLRLGSSSGKANESSSSAASSSSTPLERVRSGPGRRNWLRPVTSRESQDGTSSTASGGLSEVPENSQPLPDNEEEAIPEQADVRPVDNTLVFDGHSMRRRSIDEPVPLRRTTSGAAAPEEEEPNVSTFNFGILQNSQAATGMQRWALGYAGKKYTKVATYDEERRLPYSIMKHPTPSPSFSLYPNYTPTTLLANELAGFDSEAGVAETYPVVSNDARQHHPILKPQQFLQGIVPGGGKTIPSEWVERKLVVGDGRTTKLELQGQVLTWTGPVL